jgi:uncharacterized protein involved in exopolysaccharide biosynthesis
VQDAVIEKYRLREVYGVDYMVDARKRLTKRVEVSAGKKDGLITIEASDRSPALAAQIANEHVEQLRRLTTVLAVSEAQQRRVFFEQQLTATKDKLAAAQRALEQSGFTQGALRSEPRAAAEAYAQLRAQLTAAEVRLQTLHGSLRDDTPEVQQATATVSALRSQLARVEQNRDRAEGDYVGRYRDFKYYETLFDLFARQYEMARVDESREGALIQVVDKARPPEKKSAPSRGLITAAGTLLVLLAAALAYVVRDLWWVANRSAARSPQAHTASTRASPAP